MEVTEKESDNAKNNSPSKIEGVARRAGGVCQAATGLGDAAPMLSSHTPLSLRATSPNLGEELTTVHLRCTS